MSKLNSYFSYTKDCGQQILLISKSYYACTEAKRRCLHWGNFTFLHLQSGFAGAENDLFPTLDAELPQER